MDKKINQSESNKIIYDFLQNNPVGVLATADSQGMPHAATIYFHVDEDFNTTFTTKKDTRKNTNIMQNANVSLVAYDAETQTTVEIIGTAENIDDANESQETFDSMLRASMLTSEAGIPPINKLSAGDFVAYKIKPKQIKMAVYIRPDYGGYEMFETIDF
jgi:general stress protein 26